MVVTFHICLESGMFETDHRSIHIHTLLLFFVIPYVLLLTVKDKNLPSKKESVIHLQHLVRHYL